MCYMSHIYLELEKRIGKGDISVRDAVPRKPSVAEGRLCRMLFALMAGALMMTMRVIHELWTPVGGAYNVDGVLRVMITGLEDELDQRLKGKTFSDTRLPPPPPSFPVRPAAQSG